MNRAALAVGAAFGFLITASRLSDYDVIHKMLLIQELDVFLLMGSAVATAAPLILLLRRVGWRTLAGEPLAPARQPVERRHVFGSAVFGAGWAVAGTCPGPAVAMAVGGGVLGFVVMAGMICGIFLFDRVESLRVRAGVPSNLRPAVE